MNEQDKFECQHQEIHDDNTGVTITFGTHAGSGNKWLRIAVPDLLVGAHDSKTKTSTITFGPDGQALKIHPHGQASTGYHAPAEGSWGDSDPQRSTVEVEASLRKPTNEAVGYAEDEKVDKSAKRAKK